MQAIQLNRISARALLFLSLLALCTVLTGYFQAPQADEGTAAHIFQLTVVLAGVAGLLFLATADWTHPYRPLRSLAVPGVALFLAFAALYYLEHFYYAARHA